MWEGSSFVSSFEALGEDEFLPRRRLRHDATIGQFDPDGIGMIKKEASQNN